VMNLNTVSPVLETENISQIVCAHMVLMKMVSQFVQNVAINVKPVTITNHAVVLLVLESEPQLKTAHVQILIMKKLMENVIHVPQDVLLVKEMSTTVLLVLMEDIIHQNVNVNQVLSPTQILHNVLHVHIIVLNVLSTVVSVVETESTLHSVNVDHIIMILVNVNVQNVTTNVVNVHLTKNVMTVLTKPEKLMITVNVNQVIMMILNQNVKFVTINVLLAIILMIVSPVKILESILQLVPVLMDTSISNQTVNHVNISVKNVPNMLLTVTHVPVTELLTIVFVQLDTMTKLVWKIQNVTHVPHNVLLVKDLKITVLLVPETEFPQEFAHVQLEP
jgi:hypothetical protein